MSNTFKAEIDKLRSAYEAAVAEGDASAMSPLLEEGAVFVRPGRKAFLGGPWSFDSFLLKGRESPEAPNLKVA